MFLINLRILKTVIIKMIAIAWDRHHEHDGNRH